MRMRRLNEGGIREFVSFLDSLTTGTPLSKPEMLLVDAKFSEQFEVEVEVERRPFASRLEIAEYLFTTFTAAGVSSLEKDRGIWVWLSLFFFNVLCPRGRDDSLQPGALARWIPHTQDYRRYYRHLLAGPYLIYVAHYQAPERALALLCGAPHVMGDIVEQIASRHELVTNRAVVGVATTLYVDMATKRYKRGAGGKGSGSPRRFADVLNQLDLTFDLYAMAPGELLTLLPAEFARFRGGEATAQRTD